MARPVVAAVLHRYLRHSDLPRELHCLLRICSGTYWLSDFQTHFLVKYAENKCLPGPGDWIILARAELSVLGCDGRGLSLRFWAFCRVGGVSELSSASLQIVCSAVKYYPNPMSDESRVLLAALPCMLASRVTRTGRRPKSPRAWWG